MLQHTKAWFKKQKTRIGISVRGTYGRSDHDNEKIFRCFSANANLKDPICLKFIPQTNNREASQLTCVPQKLCWKYGECYWYLAKILPVGKKLCMPHLSNVAQPAPARCMLPLTEAAVSSVNRAASGRGECWRCSQSGFQHKVASTQHMNFFDVQSVLIICIKSSFVDLLSCIKSRKPVCVSGLQIVHKVTTFELYKEIQSPAALDNIYISSTGNREETGGDKSM